MRQTSAPESRRSSGNLDLDAGDEDLLVQALTEFLRRSALEEELERFDEVGARLFDRGALARDVELRTQCDEMILFLREDRREVMLSFHGGSVYPQHGSGSCRRSRSRRQAAGWGCFCHRS